MASNRLCLIPMKTEIIWLGSTRRIANCPLDPQDIAGAMIESSKGLDVVKPAQTERR